MAKHGNTKQLAATVRKARERNMRIIRVFCVIIAVALAFCLGFIVRGEQTVLSALGFTALVGDTPAPGAVEQRNVYNSLSERIEEVEGVITEESLDSFDLDQTTTGMLTALAEATEDPYFRYYDAAQYALLEQNAGDNYEGVGVLFGESNGSAYAVDVYENSPAQVAGVQQGDFVVAIDGDRSRQWSHTEVLAALDREEGSEVVITWRRPETAGAEGGEEFNTVLTCVAMNETNVTYSLDNQVGVITVRQITSNATDLVRAAVEDLEAQGAQSYVLDLRNVPGGYLTQAVEIANLFVRNGIIVQIETNTGVSTRQASGEVVTDKPMAVLVNENTSAAAEVLAAALQDNQRATLVGQTTMGKGSVQVVRELSFGGALRYTAAYYLSPQGRDIDVLGVVPDVVVSLADDGSDNQLELAVETAQSSLAA